MGSAPHCDLVLTDPEVSRVHFEVRTTIDRYEIVDLDSTNGTFVEGVRIYRAPIEPGSAIRVGNTTLVFQPKKRWHSLEAPPLDAFHGLIGRSERMRALFGVLERVAPTELTVLIGGETGSGKEVAARAIHRASPRASGPFVAVDCTAIAENLAESELFGHVRGAFTGAERDRPGVFEAASGGVVFLDEIGEISPSLQPKLLRALERREVRRVGSTETIGFDARVIAATHRDLARRVEEGLFREDLYYRLAEITVTLPPLSARLDDIPLLARHMLERDGVDRELTADAMRVLGAHAYPGNIRELRNVLRRAAAFSSGDEITKADVEMALAGRPTRRDPLGFTDLLEGSYRESRAAVIERFEQAYLARLLEGDETISAAAARAGIHRKSLERLMRKHGR